jgi:CBS domain-containing protein
MKAANAMTPHVVSVSAEASILDAAQLMMQHHISGLPVVDGEGKLVGIVSERDFLRSSQASNHPRWLQFLTGGKSLPDEIPQLKNRKVGEVMTRAPIFVNEDTPLEAVARLMDQHDIKRVPVLCDGKIVGIIARADLVRALVHAARKVANSTAHTTSRLTELERQAWTRQNTLR